MKAFIVKVMFFFLPIVIIFSIPCYVLWSSGENFKQIDNLIESKSKYIIGYAYNQTNYSYLKWKGLVSSGRKEVVALGSSRVLQFREQMFGFSFYNAGFTIVGIGDYIPFLKCIPPENEPEYLIIALDQWMFNYNWDSLSLIKDEENWTSGFSLTPTWPIIKDVIQDLRESKYGMVLPEFEDSLQRVGLSAYVINKGFRNDGSLQYGQQISLLLKNDSLAEDYGFSETFKRIKDGNRRFEYGDSVNLEAVKELREVLIYCKSRNIKVIGFIPPFAKKVLKEMKERERYGYLSQIMTSIKPIFDEYRYELYNFEDISILNSNDTDMIDGFHGSETLYLKILIAMLESGSILNEVADIDRLKADLENPINRYTVYSY